MSKVTKQKAQRSIFSTLRNWFMVNPIKPIAQFAALGLVFSLGFNANKNDNNIVSEDDNLTASTGIANLQQEVSSLSAMLALSMLDRSSAAERLTGVAYSQQTDLTNPLLMETLLSTLENDRSTAVKLAIINTLNHLPNISGQESQLLALTIKENNTLVKIELCGLLLNVGSEVTKNQLLKTLNASELNPDVADFLKKINAISHI